MSIIYCDRHHLKWDSDLKSECPACENEEWPECGACNGKGFIQHLPEPGFSESCQTCHGKGYIEDAQLQRERIEKEHGSLSPEMMAHLQNSQREGAIDQGAVVLPKYRAMIIRISSEYEICRFHNGEWSFRQIIGDDVAHIRYLNPFEKQLVDSALTASTSFIVGREET